MECRSKDSGLDLGSGLAKVRVMEMGTEIVKDKAMAKVK